MIMEKLLIMDTEFNSVLTKNIETTRLETLKDCFYLSHSYTLVEFQDKLAKAISMMEQDGIREREPIAYLKKWNDSSSGM